MKKFISLFILVISIFIFSTEGYCAENFDFAKILSGKRIGVQAGTRSPEIVEELVPTAIPVYLDTPADNLIALRTGKIDAACLPEPVARLLMAHNNDVVPLGEKFNKTNIASIFTKSEKGEKLCKEYSDFVKTLWDDGTISEIDSIWLGVDEDKKILKDYKNFPATNGVLKMAVDLSMLPFDYVKDNKIVGYDIDIASRFCEAKGYALEVVPMSFQAIVPSVNTGKCDFSCGLARTPERAEAVLFASTPNQVSGGLMVVKKPDTNMKVLDSSSEKFASIEDLAGKNIGVQTGTTIPEIVKKFVPTAILNYFESQTDIFTALKAGRIDALCTDMTIARYVIAIDDSYVQLGEKVVDIECAPIFPKTEAGEKLCKEFSDFNKLMWENGTIKEIDSIWYGNDESKKTVKDYSNLPAPNGVLRMAADLSVVPFTYVKNNKIVGYDVDCVVRFCEAYGYGLEIVPMAFGGIIPALQSGKCDFAACVVTYTEERAEKVLYAYPNIKNGIAFYIRKSDSQASALSQGQDSEDKTSFIEEIRASFERTFIREDRWQLFIQGIINTMIITILSILFGTVLGFIMYLSCRRGNFIANAIAGFFVWLIQGMPLVVLLMIFYYIIFGKVDIAGIWVAVIAFSMTFGSSFYSMLRSGVNAIDKGQTEAAYALGFTDRQSFFTIILPQAAQHFMPTYKADVVALVKATAIVGYIAVQDLTKMGDIVRSRTYEAFFPLIAVAIIYFILAGILNFVVEVVSKRLQPNRKKRENILKGLKTHD